MGSHLGVKGIEGGLKVLGEFVESFLLRTRERCFTYYNRPIFNATWTGDTHKETDILPGNRQYEDSRQ